MASRRRRSLINGKRRSKPYCAVDYPSSPFHGMTVGEVEDLPPKKRARLTKEHNKIILDIQLSYQERLQQQQHHYKNQVLSEFDQKVAEIAKEIAKQNAEQEINNGSNDNKNKTKSKNKSTRSKNKNKTKSTSSEDDEEEFQDIDVLPTNANLQELDARVVNDSKRCSVSGSARLVAQYCGKSKLHSNSNSNPNHNSNNNSNSNSNSNTNENSNGTINNVINVFQMSGDEDVDVSTSLNIGGNAHNGGQVSANRCNLNQGPPPLEPVADSAAGSRIQWTKYMHAVLYKIVKEIADTGKINGQRLHGGANLTNGEWRAIHKRFENDIGMKIDIRKLQGKWTRTVGAQGKTRCPKLHAVFAPVWEQIKIQLSKSTSSNNSQSIERYLRCERRKQRKNEKPKPKVAAKKSEKTVRVETLELMQETLRGFSSFVA